jgi:antitoxin component YwqK of YwqJK toxin-antitoxin module
MRLILFSLLFLLLFSACNIETIETQNEYGRRVRYERRKDDFAKHGRFVRYHDNGAIAEEAQYVNDTLDGERKLFYPGGQLESLEVYKKGVLDGPFRRYHENGALYIEQEFRKGVMDGFSLRYYPNGQLEEKVTIRNNEENGPFVEYHQNGKIKAEGTYTYEDGAMEQGELKEYDENGVLIRIADCERGICRTRWKKE